MKPKSQNLVPLKLKIWPKLQNIVPVNNSNIKVVYSNLADLSMALGLGEPATFSQQVRVIGRVFQGEVQFAEILLTTPTF